jgi:hypothetical protein
VRKEKKIERERVLWLDGSTVSESAWWSASAWAWATSKSVQKVRARFEGREGVWLEGDVMLVCVLFGFDVVCVGVCAIRFRCCWHNFTFSVQDNTKPILHLKKNFRNLHKIISFHRALSLSLNYLTPQVFPIWGNFNMSLHLLMQDLLVRPLFTSWSLSDWIWPKTDNIIIS